MIDKINAVPGLLSHIKTDSSEQVSSGKGFIDVIERELSDVDKSLKQSEAAIREFSIGREQSLPSVMLAIERSRSSFQMMVQVRNRLMEGYNEIIKMQV